MTTNRALALIALTTTLCACDAAPAAPGDASGEDDAGTVPPPASDGGTPPPVGTGPWYEDSDGDGVADAVEEHAGTDPHDPSESPRTRGDFFFIVPYLEEPTPPRDTLVFGTSLQRADVHFMIDTSISMQGYIDTVRDGLVTTVIPGLHAAIPDVALGVGQFDVCPETQGYRPGMCEGIAMEQTSTTDPDAVVSALDTLTADCSPVAEPYAQAAWVWATGDTARFPGMDARSCPAGTTGLGCVREGSLPILVVIGDEPFSQSYRSLGPCRSEYSCVSCTSGPSPDEVAGAFAAIGGRLVVLGPTGTSPEWGPLVAATGAVDEAGNPLVFPGAGMADIDRAVVDAIARLAAATPFDLTARAVDLDDDGVDASAFVERVEPNVAGGVADRRDPSRVCVGGLATIDADGDGFADTFPDVTVGTPVCFDIVVRRNEIVPAGSEPRILRAAIEVVGDGITVLDRRTVYFLVPADGGGPILI